MNATVIGFHKKFSNQGYPFTLARLSCGHLDDATIEKDTGECVGCGTRAEVFTTCACGARGRGKISFANPHEDANILTKVGETRECKACVREADQLVKLKEVLTRSDLSHSRFRFEMFHLYRRDAASPSGVSLVLSVSDTPAVRELLTGALSPLSPTEPR